jgi:hypothetical protein
MEQLIQHHIRCRKKAGTILVTGGNNLVSTPEDEDLIKRSLDKATRAAIEAVKLP